MNLNLGCGSRKIDGFVNVDKSSVCEPDMVVDLETFPWPFEDNSVEAIVLNHCLEHLGQTASTFIDIMKEMYRVCRPGAEILINVPHPRHDHFISDPTHVRAITPALLQTFSKAQNRRWIELGYANTTLGLYHDIDFEIKSSTVILADDWKKKHEEGKISLDELNFALSSYWNVASEFRVLLVAVK
jgi:predicted SAM-dependent methyltransferase